MSELWVLSRGSEIISGPMSFEDALSYAKPTGRTHIRPIPEKYLGASFSAVEAEAIAREYIEKHVKINYVHLTFNAPQPRGGDAMRFTFFAFCHEWVAAGKVPGAFTCSVDRIDGHIWSQEEFGRFGQIYESIS